MDMILWLSLVHETRQIAYLWISCQIWNSLRPAFIFIIFLEGCFLDKLYDQKNVSIA